MKHITKKRPVTVYLPEDVCKRLHLFAKLRQVQLTILVEKAVTEFLDRRAAP